MFFFDKFFITQRFGNRCYYFQDINLRYKIKMGYAIRRIEFFRRTLKVILN